MKHYVRFVERHFPTGESSAEVYINGLCVGEWHWNYHRDGVWYDYPFTGRLHIGTTTMEDCARRLVESGLFNHNYEYNDGACHYEFDTATGYKFIEDYNRCFPEVAEHLIIIETEA